MECPIDVSHNFWKYYLRTKKDPDSHDPILRRYHRLLWSKPLPNGKMLSLDEYLRHNSELGSFSFSSDSFMHTFSEWKRYQHVIVQIPKSETERFYSLAGTIGGITIFPSNKVEGKMTINGAKGCDSKILDRIDLTMECIRRHYEGGKSPLSETLERYRSFFDLFTDFKGYAEFFMMQDMVAADQKIKFLCSFDGFRSSPLPDGVDEYIRYKDNSISFLERRNDRIKNWAEENLHKRSWF